MGYNKVKAIKRISRQQQGQYGKAGAHIPKPYKEKFKKQARDYLNEFEENVFDAEHLPDEDEESIDQQLYLQHCSEQEDE